MNSASTQILFGYKVFGHCTICVCGFRISLLRVRVFWLQLGPVIARGAYGQVRRGTFGGVAGVRCNWCAVNGDVSDLSGVMCGGASEF